MVPVPGSCSASSADSSPRRGRHPPGLAGALPRPGDPVELGRLPGLLALFQREAAHIGRAEEGGGPHPVHLDVVGVAVAAEGVVGGHHLGAVAADEAHQAAHRLHEVGPPEGAGMVVLRGPRHARVAVAEQFHRGHPEDGRRPPAVPPRAPRPGCRARRRGRRGCGSPPPRRGWRSPPPPARRRRRSGPGCRPWRATRRRDGRGRRGVRARRRQRSERPEEDEGGARARGGKAPSRTSPARSTRARCSPYTA